MQNIKYFTFFVLLLNFQMAASQSVEISGRVESRASKENIHVINKTAQVFTTTNKIGEFKIPVKLNDTLIFSSIQHIPKQIIVSKNVILRQALIVKLEEQINELDEVLVGKVLTGDLLYDVKNIEGDPPINFYDVGISGYTGKPATQGERRLNEATTGSNGQKLKWYSPLTGQIPLNPIINAISGRTKMLKNHIKLEENDESLQKIKAKFSDVFFSTHQLDESKQTDFFNFCADDVNFTKQCKGKSDIEIIGFLEEKLNAYKKNLEFKP